MKLSELKEQQTAVLKRVDLKKIDQLRLLHLGFYVGANIQCIRFAPMMDPAVYSICGNDIILRKEDAQFIEVEVII